MDKVVQCNQSNMPDLLDRAHGLNEIVGSQVRARRCQMRYGFGQVVSWLDRSILLMVAGLFLSVSAFSQTPGGQADPYPTREQTIQFPAKQDKTPVDSHSKLIMDRMLAARVLYPSNVEEPRQADFHYSKFARAPESVFGEEVRMIQGPGGSIPFRLYAPNERLGLPLWPFFNGSSFLAVGPVTDAVPLRAVTNRCDCLVVTVGYQLGLENRFPAVPENAYVATSWVAEHRVEIVNDPKTLLSATPPGTFGLPATPWSPQTPTTEAYRTGGNIDLTTLAAHFRVGQWFRRQN